MPASLASRRGPRRRRGSRSLSAASLEETVIIGPSTARSPRVGQAVADAAQVRGEQHRLHEARAHVHALWLEAAQAAPVVDERPRLDAGARAQVAPHGAHARSRREAGGKGVPRHRAAPARLPAHVHLGEAPRVDVHAPRAARGGGLAGRDPVDARRQPPRHPHVALLGPPPHHDVAVAVPHLDVREGALDRQPAARRLGRGGQHEHPEHCGYAESPGHPRDGTAARMDCATPRDLPSLG